MRAEGAVRRSLPLASAARSATILAGRGHHQVVAFAVQYVTTVQQRLSLTVQLQASGQLGRQKTRDQLELPGQRGPDSLLHVVLMAQRCS